MSSVTYEGMLVFYKHSTKERVATAKVTFNSMTDIERCARVIERELDLLSCQSDDYIDHKFNAKITHLEG